MPFENFWRGGRDRDESDRDRNRWGSRERSHREERDDYGRRFSTGDDQNYERRGWRQGSDYYGNRDDDYDRGDYGQRYAGREGYGSADEYRDDYLGNRWRQDQRYGGGDFGGRGYARGGYGGQDYADQYGMQEQQFRGRGPRGYRRSDERIREDVCDFLTDDPRIDASNMEVTVKDGEVTLSGTVTSREDKRRAEDLIEQLSGVKDVHNTLRIASEPRSGSEQRGANEKTSSQTARH